MKKILACILCIVLVVAWSGRVSAEEFPVSSPAAQEQVEVYQFPYPGMLPDNPLYKLKIVRDKIVEFLIADSLKKSEFYLLAAEKRFAAGVSLLKTNPKNEQLAYSTISKSENYFEKSIRSAEEAKAMGKDIKTLSSSMRLSIRKQIAIIESLEKNGPNSLKGNFTSSLKRMRKFAKAVNSFAPTE